jgi:HEAT repeat protein
LETSSQLGDTEVLQKAILDPDLAIQKASFEALAASDPAGAVDSLLRAAHSDNADMRVQAIELLVEVFPVDPGSALSALRGALADKDASVKAAAIQALATQGGAEATALLRQALHDSDPSERLLVIQSVAQTAEGLPLLQEASSDMDEAVRAFASGWLTPPDSEAN